MNSWSTRQVSQQCAEHVPKSAAPGPLAATGLRVLRLSVDSASVTTLRQLAMRVCGDALEFMRIAVCAGGQRIAVWLCVQLGFVALLSETVQRQLPGARLGDHHAAAGELP
ncbi:hypothetical protein [Massilia sp. PWRC2]|uniref:hypothetical protein n=1 Tax=Massilia sp. PWRC2 TaxID=2804626 RepID=UPI003CF2D616